MSNYVKATDFSVKDGLLPGNPAKIVKGTEIDDEFDAISAAIQTKADLSSPTFTGTPAAPTASPGTNTTQIATTAFANAAATAATTALSLGTIATQNANNVSITGGAISNTTINTFVVGSNATGTKTVSTSGPTGGNNGDIWYQV